MPLCTVHLLALHPTTPNPILTFLSTLQSSNIKPLVVSRVIRWIIRPTDLSTEHLIARNIRWDIYLVLPGTEALPSQLEELIQHHWTITAGVPSRLIQDFASKNEKLLHPAPGSLPSLSTSTHADSNSLASSSQDLEISPALQAWINDFTSSANTSKEAHGAVSMFNLLAFKPNMKSEYLKYGAAFADSVGSRFGGNAKIVGNVVNAMSSSSSQEASSDVHDASQDGWHEIALAHYPSILHFRDMLLSKEYQEVNKRHRVGSLRDTAILMTSEVGVGEMMGGGYGGAKL